MLVNNAGIGTAGGREESADGYELTFAVNYLAPFLLTRRLLPLIERSAPSRIVNVSSAGQAPIDFQDVMLERTTAVFRPTARASSPWSCSPSTWPRSSRAAASRPTACTPGPTCRPTWSTRPGSSP